MIMGKIMIRQTSNMSNTSNQPPSVSHLCVPTMPFFMWWLHSRWQPGHMFTSNSVPVTVTYPFPKQTTISQMLSRMLLRLHPTFVDSIATRVILIAYAILL